MFNPTIIGN